MLDGSGCVIGASKIARDIRERRTAEMAQLRLAAIVQSSDDAIISKDLNGIVTSWNPAAERMFGYSAEEMIGTSITRIIPPSRLAEEDYVLGRIRAGLSVEHFETVRPGKDGRLVDISLTVSPDPRRLRARSLARRRSRGTSASRSGRESPHSGSAPSSSRPTMRSSARI